MDAEEISSRNSAPQPLPAPPVPRPWWQIFAALTLLTLLGGVTVALAAGVVRQQPEPLSSTREMHQASTGIDEALSRSFLESRIPETNIQQAPSLPVPGAQAAPAKYDFTVQVPAEVDLEALIARVRENMAAEGIEVHQTQKVGGGRLLKLSRQGTPIASALLSPQPAPRDLQPGSARLAAETMEILRTQGATVAQEGDSKLLADDQATWKIAELHAQFRTTPDTDRLRDALVTGLAINSADVSLQPQESDWMEVEIALEGRTVVRTLCTVEALPVADNAAAAPDSEKEPALVLAKHVETNADPSPPLVDPVIPPPPDPAVAIIPPVLQPELEKPLENSVLEEEQLARSNATHAPRVQFAPAAGEKPRLALIIDDGGYGGERTDRLLALDSRLTLAILPNTPFGRETAERALEKGFQVMLHMPMETYGSPFPGEIKTSMDAAEIERLTLDALSQIPGVVGVNNHTGSKFTRDAERMADFLKVIKPKNLFFIDSITITHSAAYEVARGMEIRSGQRDIFIDNSSSPDLIRRQLREVVKRAKARGSAIGIGHFRPNTVTVLESELPRLEEYGVELVHASELVR